MNAYHKFFNFETKMRVNVTSFCMTATFLKMTKLSGFLKGNFSYDGGGTIPKKPYSFKPFTKPMRGE